MRREDYQPRRTHPDSPFRHFVVKCLQCDSLRISVTMHYDEVSGDKYVLFLCRKCGEKEKMVVRV